MSLLGKLWDAAFHQPPPPDPEVAREERQEGLARIERRTDELLAHGRKGVADLRSIRDDLREVRSRLRDEPFPIVGEPRGGPRR
jgi:hypothetical protein